MLPNRVTYVKLVELDMLDLDGILGMDWLHVYFCSKDCTTWVVKFNIQIIPFYRERGKNSIRTGSTISFLKSCKMISKRCLYHIVRVKDLDSKIPPIESVSVVR